MCGDQLHLWALASSMCTAQGALALIIIIIITAAPLQQVMWALPLPVPNSLECCCWLQALAAPTRCTSSRAAPVTCVARKQTARQLSWWHWTAPSRAASQSPRCSTRHAWRSTSSPSNASGTCCQQPGANRAQLGALQGLGLSPDGKQLGVQLSLAPVCCRNRKIGFPCPRGCGKATKFTSPCPGKVGAGTALSGSWRPAKCRACSAG